MTNPNGISCGHCKQRHATAREVYLCSRGEAVSPPVEDGEAARISALRAAVAAIPVGSRGYGFYALGEGDDVSFYRVERPTAGRWAGRTFVKAQGSEQFYPIERGPAWAILTRIAADPEAAGMLYATKLERCRDCRRKLTDKESRAAGRGPDCRSKPASRAA